MRVFVTGATGFVGSPVVQDLFAHGYEVVGLARSDKSAAALERVGVGVVRGTTEDLDVLRTAAADTDGVIHTAYIHDFSPTANPMRFAEIDRDAIAAFGEALAGTGMPLVVAAGLYRLALEQAPAGTLLNAVGDEAVPFKDVAAAIGRSLNLPVKSVSAEEAPGHFGMPLAIFAQLDVPASSKRTREQFGWEPVEPGLIADIDARHYANAGD